MSAVDGSVRVVVACGVGVLLALRVLLALTSVLDLLYWYLVCIEHFLHYLLVGGCFDIASYCGIIVVSCLDNSSLLNISRGARLLIRDLMCLSAIYCMSCRR